MREDSPRNIPCGNLISIIIEKEGIKTDVEMERFEGYERFLISNKCPIFEKKNLSHNKLLLEYFVAQLAQEEQLALETERKKQKKRKKPRCCSNRWIYQSH